MTAPRFDGFPATSKATAIPNLFFERVLPGIEDPATLLAFLWTARALQEERRTDAGISAAELWSHGGLRASFEHLAPGGLDALERGLAACVESGALLAVPLARRDNPGPLYFVNNPRSRRLIARAVTGQVELRAATMVAADPSQGRPGIFRLYEEHIGTVTPLVAERLANAETEYPPAWIEDAFREAAERNVRNWRYIETILESWAREGRADEGTPSHPIEDAQQRYLGGRFGHLARFR